MSDKHPTSDELRQYVSNHAMDWPMSSEVDFVTSKFAVIADELDRLHAENAARDAAVRGLVEAADNLYCRARFSDKPHREYNVSAKEMDALASALAAYKEAAQ